MVGVKNRLKEIRMKDYMMKQKEFAELLEINNKTYFYIEKGTSLPSVGIALRFAEKLNMKVEDIWFLDKD